MELYYREYGDQQAPRPPLVLLHGLFGSCANWHGLARRIGAEHRVLVTDLRNHGRSPHAEPMSYAAMGEDVLELLDRLQCPRAMLVGHSMGAKVAMWLALTQGARVARLVAVDMAPVTYPNRLAPIPEALASLDLERLTSRNAAEAWLAPRLRNPRLRQYLLQNLVYLDDRWQWRVNLPILGQELAELVAFPPLAPETCFTGPSLFIYGEASDYVTGHQPAIQRLFPQARLCPVAEAGHWVYAERPEQFLACLLPFLAEEAGRL